VGKLLIICLISLVSLAAVFFLVDLTEVLDTLARLDFMSLALTSTLIVLSNIVAMARFRAVLGTLNAKVGWRDVLFAFSVGQVSNQFLLNILGQSVTRAMSLARAGVSVSVSLMATYIERLLAAGLLFVFSLASLWLLLHHITFDLEQGGGYIAFLLASIVLVTGAVLIVTLRYRIVLAMRAAVRWCLRLWWSALLTILSQALMLAAYLAVLRVLTPDPLGLSVIAALIVVMFTASLPISFSGWGLRELSAGAVLSAIGMPASAAVTAAFAIGILSIIVMFGFAAVSLLLKRPRAEAAAQRQDDSGSLAQHFRHWDALFIAGSALFCAVFMFFQVRLPRPHGDLTVNPADIAAITGLAVLAYFVLTRRIRFPLPRFITYALLVFSGVLAAGLLSAYLQGTLGSWALINRGVGWFIILGYVAIGASAVAIGGEDLRALILKVVVLAASAVCLVQLSVMAYSYLVTQIPLDVFPFPLEGFVNNQNAFSFQLCIVVVILIALSRVNTPTLQTTAASLAFLLLTLTIYYTKSRSGLILLGGLILAMLLLSATRFASEAMNRRRLRVDAALMVAALLIAIALPYAILEIAKAVGSPETGVLAYLARPDALGVKITHEGSAAERALILAQSLELWRAHRWLGAGLGSFVEWRVATGQAPQVIHSIPIWLMAEMGLVGLVVVLATSIFVVVRIWRTMVAESSRWALALLGVLACIAVDGLAHDLFYQRIFWFLLGVLCVAPSPGTILESTGTWRMTAATGRVAPSPAR
jgi:uncharacterized membrane protein YbhN (UPF0104 family)/O-antigen ligase